MAQHNNGELEETSGGRAISGIFLRSVRLMVPMAYTVPEEAH